MLRVLFYQNCAKNEQKLKKHTWLFVSILWRFSLNNLIYPLKSIKKQLILTLPNSKKKFHFIEIEPDFLLVTCRLFYYRNAKM